MADKWTKLPSHGQEDAVSDASSGQGSDVMRCALGIVMHRLGLNFYETEESKDGLAYLKKSFELMDSLPNALKLRHLNTIQDLYNHIAIIMSDRGGDDKDKQV